MKKLFLAMAVAIVTVTVVSAQENSRGSIMVVSSVQPKSVIRKSGFHFA